jgi:hypothetical protein
MPSTRPFISFLFGNLNGNTNSTPPPSRQPPYGRSTVPTRVTPVRGTSPSAMSVTGMTGPVTSPSANTLSASATAIPAPYPIPQKPSNMDFLGPNYNERRNSASSLNGVGGDKWWIGGISSDGSERYYRLQPLQRKDSFDGISMDRLSI